MASAGRQTGNSSLGAHAEAASTFAVGQGPAFRVRCLMLGSVVDTGSSLDRWRVARSDGACELLGIRVLALRGGGSRVRVHRL